MSSDGSTKGGARDHVVQPRSIPIQPRRVVSEALSEPQSLTELRGSPRSASPFTAGTPPGRQRRRSSNSGSRPRLTPSKTPLSTHSPVALAAAAQVTPERLLQLLNAQGPLPIRHITSNLAQHITGFGDLSLSKQRRLIIAVLENGDPKKDIVFEKVGWGRWAVQGDERARETPEEEDELELEGVPRRPRGSISSAIPRHKLPLSPSLSAVDDAVFSDSEEAGTDEEDWSGLKMETREQAAIEGLVRLSATSPSEQGSVPRRSSLSPGIAAYHQSRLSPGGAAASPGPGLSTSPGANASRTRRSSDRERPILPRP